MQENQSGRVYALCRVSHISSVLSDISIPAQRNAIREYKRQHYPKMKWGEACFPDDETKGFFIDRAVSAWSKMFAERPGSSKLLGVLREGDVLLIHSVNRGFRNIVDFCQTMSALTARGVTVKFISEDAVNLSTASGKLMGNILASIAQYSSDIKSERIREAHAIKKLGLGEKKVYGVRMKSDWAASELGGFFDAKKETQDHLNGTVYSYIRCSHEKSLESQLGLKAQESGVNTYVDKLISKHPSLKRGVLFRDEAVSAFSIPFNKRPDGSKLLKALKPGDHIVVYRLDRAWRSIQDAAKMVDELTKMGVHVHLVTDGVSTMDEFGKLMFNTLAYVAWMESHLISKKSCEVANHLRSQGRPIGSVPSGLKIKRVNNKKKLTLDMKSIAKHRSIYELKQLLKPLGDEHVWDVLMAWERKKTNLPAKKLRKTVLPVRTIAMYAGRYPKMLRYFQEKGLELPKAPGPQDDPEFGEILKTALPYRCIQKLKNNKRLEGVLRC